MSILNLNDAPSDPLERLLWLSGVKEAAARELEDAYAKAYAEARMERRFDAALSLHLHGKKRALAFTRRWNSSQSRMIRWGDGIDPTSTAFDG
jgi:hypothetical protein